MKTSTKFLIIVIAAFGIMSCKKMESISKSDFYENIENLDDLVAPEDFDYNAFHEVNFEIKLYTPNGSPISGIPVQINQVANGQLKEIGKLITNASGEVHGVFNIPSFLTSVVISPNYVGIPNDVIVPIEQNNVRFVFNLDGMPQNKGLSGFVPFIPSNRSMKSNILNYKYLSGFNSKGVPNNLESKRDTITTQMLNFINNSLPERKNVPTYHPTYLQNNLNTDIDITKQADVWITFVHEGAGYTNSLCYYTYKTSSPPTSYSQIDTFYVVFPNASYYNSGGGLYGGDKVNIGRFEPGTSIGFAIVSNGWNGQNVGDGLYRLFSAKELNKTTNSALSQQLIMLYDKSNSLFYFGFEDISRENSSCDNDFNDLVFYAKSNPVESISSQNVALVDDAVDKDKDGVSDIFDDFPNDATLAYRNFFPNQNEFGTFAFEDSWPGKGDYDFNDLVLGYQFEQWLGADNKVKNMQCRFAVRAIGAHYFHGFGFQMENNGSEIGKISGAAIFDGKIRQQ